MGFGLLFVGYFTVFLMSFNPIGFLFKLAGYLMMLYSFIRLRSYNRSFDGAMYASILLVMTSTLGAVSKVGTFLYDNLYISSFPLGEGFSNVLSEIDNVLILVFHGLLFLAIRAISVETGVEKTAANSVRNFIFICMYFAMCVVADLPFEFVNDFKMYLSLPTMLLYLACIILNLILIFTCYANICDENDVDMPLKRSRFEFVNKIREETARREQKAADENLEYMRQRAQEKALKRQNRKRRK